MTEREHLDARAYPELTAVWRTNLDFRTCDTCRDLDSLPVGKGVGLYDAPPHPDCENPDGCRCTIEVVPTTKVVGCSVGGCPEPPVVSVSWAGDPTVLFRFCRTHGQEMLDKAREPDA